MTQDFTLRISAVDGATKVFKRVSASMASTFKPALEKQRALNSSTRDLPFDKIGKGIGTASNASIKLANSMSSLMSPMQSVLGLGAAGGFLGVGAAVVGLEASWARMGFEINRTSQLIGVSADDLQLYRGIAKSAGIDTEAMTTAMANLGDTLHRTLYQGDSKVSTVLDALSMSIKKTPEGVVDTTAALLDLSRAISRVVDPHTRRSIAEAFGVEGILPILSRGPMAIKEMGDEVRKSGYVMEGSALKAADEYGKSIDRLMLTATAAAKVLGFELTPAVDWATRLFQRGIDIRTKDAHGATGAWERNPRMSGGQVGNDASTRSGGTAAGSIFTGMPNAPSLYRVDPAEQRKRDIAAINQVSREYEDATDPAAKEALSKELLRRESSLGRGNPKAGGDAAASAPVEVTVKFVNAPPGTTAQAKAAGSFIPTRINYTMPAGGQP